MYSKKILAISSSRVGNSGYLENAVPLIENFLRSEETKIAFLPFASADGNYEEYTNRIKDALKKLPYSLKVVLPENAEEIIAESDVLMTGGGNTFKLLHDIYALGILDIIRSKINAGTPYIGWSAGANITGATIGTTNDMPVIQPKSFNALGVFPFQINPHYVNIKKKGFNGETRDDRLKEFMIMNPGKSIIGLPEGTALKLYNNHLKFIGDVPGVLFFAKKGTGQIIREKVAHETDLTYLMQNI
ncbi:MAG TPA: dipeptidase PepE [Hanamia sp.]